jgi:VanZ family protein
MDMSRSRRLALWLPPLLLMAVIFVFSDQPNLNSGLGTVDLIGRKLIHFGEYALLCFLWWRPLAVHLGPRRAALVAFLISSAYAASDEYHQTFVEGRSGSPVDWAIDSAGAALAAMRLRAGARRRAVT